MVVTGARFLRALRMFGFPCEPVGPPVKLPPAGATAVAAFYDMLCFDERNAQKRPDFLRWISTIETTDGTVVTGRNSALITAERLDAAGIVSSVTV